METERGWVSLTERENVGLWDEKTFDVSEIWKKKKKKVRWGGSVTRDATGEISGEQTVYGEAMVILEASEKKHWCAPVRTWHAHIYIIKMSTLPKLITKLNIPLIKIPTDFVI